MTYPRHPGINRSEPEVESRLLSELASSLYAQAILPFGKASELAGMSRYIFADLMAERKIPRHYGTVELTQDLGYAARHGAAP